MEICHILTVTFKFSLSRLSCMCRSVHPTMFAAPNTVFLHMLQVIKQILQALQLSPTTTLDKVVGGVSSNQ